MIIVGIDLSGPSNNKDTVLVAFKETKQGNLSLFNTQIGADDENILTAIKSCGSEDEIIIGIDAPLSYNIGGGDRSSDADLRKKIISAGLRPGSVMPPTLTRMAYLTLRGISVARFLQSVIEKVEIVEVHPGATMVLRGAPVKDVIEFKSSNQSRQTLLHWLNLQGLNQITEIKSPSDHYVAACACALSAWKWHQKQSIWIKTRKPPFHPFDYAC